MNQSLLKMAYGLNIRGALDPAYEEILSTDALQFLQKLHQQFETRRQDLLAQRQKWYQDRAKALPLSFPKASPSRKAGNWKIDPIPDYLQDRRVEITGPPDRKMIINALNSGAKVFMADLEDSHSPTWRATMQAQINLKDAVRGQIAYRDPQTKKEYALGSEPALLFVRPRGWHLPEKHFYVDEQPMSATLFDFGLYFFHNAQYLMSIGKAPLFYLPKIEHYPEAALWDDVFEYAQKYLKIPVGSIKATVLIETLSASFEMDEILFALKRHSAGLNCGRWDYIFSFIKSFRYQPDYLLPDRSLITMESPFMAAYAERLIQVCHQRGAHAMGGMAAQIPIKNNPTANAEAFAKVRKDKLREVKLGHDGTWVSHPALVAEAQSVFDEYMPEPNQIERLPNGRQISAEALTRPPSGPVSEEGLRANIRIGLLYLSAWLSGQGAAAINHLMEDAATAEISRAQVWQWLHYGVELASGQKFTPELYHQLLSEERQAILSQDQYPESWRRQVPLADEIFTGSVLKEHLDEFITLQAYPHL